MDGLLIIVGFVAALIPAVLAKRVHRGASTVKRTVRAVLFMAVVFCEIIAAYIWLQSYGWAWDRPGQTSLLVFVVLGSVVALAVSAFLQPRTSGGRAVAVATLSLIEACAFSVSLFFVALSWCMTSREFPFCL